MRVGPATALLTALALGAGATLATVLTSDGNRFDHDARDFDIATQAILAVLEAKPGSPVGVLTEGRQRVTAFVPTDRAFKALVFDLTGTWFHKERKAFAAAATLGIDTVETVLLYHVVADGPSPRARSWPPTAPPSRPPRAVRSRSTCSTRRAASYASRTPTPTTWTRPRFRGC